MRGGEGRFGVIGEPEMEGGEHLAEPADLVSDADRPPLLGRLRNRPWAWAAGAVVLTSAAWAGALQATGYGRTSAPDLHGYHIGRSACAGSTLQPLVDSLGARTFDEGTLPTLSHSSAVDHVNCQLSALGTSVTGWQTEYTISVEVDLHKKTDPAAEFDAVSQSKVLTPPPGNTGLAFLFTDDKSTTTHPTGLGDRANLVSGHSRQTLSVRHGGAVFVMTLTARTEWDTSLGPAPLDKHGAPKAAPFTDTKKFAKDLPPAMRRLMAVLADPTSESEFETEFASGVDADPDTGTGS